MDCEIFNFCTVSKYSKYYLTWSFIMHIWRYHADVFAIKDFQVFRSFFSIMSFTEWKRCWSSCGNQGCFWLLFHAYSSLHPTFNLWHFQEISWIQVVLLQNRNILRRIFQNFWNVSDKLSDWLTLDGGWVISMGSEARGEGNFNPMIPKR